MAKLDRRSFLARVAGGAVGGSALLVLGVGARATEPEAEGERRLVVDADPGDPAREPPEPSPESRPATTGVTDWDSGPNADPLGGGRNSGQNARVSDSDSGRYADPAGQGRHGTRTARRRAGITDSDSGANADAAGSGRGGSGGGIAPRQSFVICPGHPRCPQ